MRNSKKSYLYILSILYLCSVYLIPIIYLFNKEFNPFAFTIPVLLTVFNSVAAILLRRDVSREDFLGAAILIKYGMIPFYCFGSLINLLLVLTIIIPLPFMLFLTGSGVLIAWIIGWFLMVGSAPFALVYIFKTKEEGSVPKSLCILSAICQFILLTDVITIMAMCFKDKKFVKTTLGVLIGSILLIGLIFIGLINYAV